MVELVPKMTTLTSVRPHPTRARASTAAAPPNCAYPTPAVSIHLLSRVVAPRFVILRADPPRDPRGGGGEPKKTEEDDDIDDGARPLRIPPVDVQRVLKVTRTMKGLERAGLTERQAQELLSKWEKSGVKDADGLRRMFVGSASGPLVRRALQLAFDAVFASTSFTAAGGLRDVFGGAASDQATPLSTLFVFSLYFAGERGCRWGGQGVGAAAAARSAVAATGATTEFLSTTDNGHLQPQVSTSPSRPSRISS